MPENKFQSDQDTATQNTTPRERLKQICFVLALATAFTGWIIGIGWVAFDLASWAVS
jgi:hypothetical protein